MTARAAAPAFWAFSRLRGSRDRTGGVGLTKPGREASDRLAAKIDAAGPTLARAIVGALRATPMFRRHLAGASHGDWPVAVAGPTVAGAIAARSRTVRLSGETAAKQTVRHPDLAPQDYGLVQRILDDGELFRSRYHSRAVEAFIEMDGRPWRAVVKATRDGSKTYLETFHKAQPRDLAAARRRRKKIDREGK